MGTITQPQPVQHFCGVIFAPGTDLDSLRADLEADFGPIDNASDQFSFDSTDFYEKEMGKNLRKTFYSFEKLICPGGIAGIKIRTNEIESRYLTESDPATRSLNLDPGYITQAKMVLASTKDFYHRLFLRDGIYAETTLQFTKKSFQPFPWTYPDYKKPEYIEFFNTLRSRYKEKLKTENFSVLVNNYK